ncbi:hypothetical protein K438DRAFT_1777209 [Mycena galopus ATCC 62051]|nr:hypothetical protein K438DRAFT_1777209 [Mycena galopus ATCC 62051]
MLPDKFEPGMVTLRNALVSHTTTRFGRSPTRIAIMKRSTGGFKGSSTSQKIKILSSGYDAATGSSTAATLNNLSQSGQDRYREAGAEDLRERLRNMSEEHLEAFRALRKVPEDRTGDMDDDENFGPGTELGIQDVLDGSVRMDYSHAGGEFIETLQDGIEEVVKNKKKSAPDYRVRTDRIQKVVDGWAGQMDRMVHAYMAWCAATDLGTSNETTERMVESFNITVVDLYESNRSDVELSTDGAGVPAALIKQGLIPCSPWDPSVAIATRMLELYRTTHIRCPQLAIQSFVKSLCDLHGVPYRPYLREQFSIAYDLYLELRRQTDHRVNVALGRDTPGWRLKHTCPACMYKLEGEEDLIFSMLVTMDGNDSLKRVLRRTKTDGSEEEPVLGPSKEREDSRDGGEDYFLSREEVDKWAKGRVADVLPTDANNPCSDRWKNMINDVTSRMWGIFDETGIFLGLCRHGFVLVVADMVRSGELAKYPLALCEVFLDAFGLKIGNGYDIGCHFGTTLNNSELRGRMAEWFSMHLGLQVTCSSKTYGSKGLIYYQLPEITTNVQPKKKKKNNSELGDKARRNKFQSLVGSFHGHAHNRLCQLSFLATYVDGMGLEDLEGCEQYFSRSNGLAKSVRYASKFHRRQDITTFMKQMDDLETYANLSKFLCDDYQQALKILKTEPALKRWMVQEGIEDYDMFHVWLEEEKEYLLGLNNTLPKKREQTPEMEYVQRLVNLIRNEQARADDADFNPSPISPVARRHAIEQRDRDLELVQDLELKLGVEERWTSTSLEWMVASDSIRNHKYQEAINEIEKIIVQRLLEMTKIHASGTGYKMRSHIAKSLQARSKSIRKAIDKYNTVALSMDPPMPSLAWDEVVNYCFLAEFDILRDMRDSICSRPWTRQNYQVAMDSYFKILQAQEEIKRLNIEIKQVVTWINDEDLFLRKKEDEYQESDPALAVQILRYRLCRARSDTNHMHRFWTLAKLPGFTGSVSPGVSVERKEARRREREVRLAEDEDMEADVVVEDRTRWAPASGQWRDEEDEGDIAEGETVSELMYQMSVLAVDRAEVGGLDLSLD